MVGVPSGNHSSLTSDIKMTETAALRYASIIQGWMLAISA